MTNSTKEEISSYEYEAVLKKKSGRYHFHIEELRIVGSGENVESAYRNLMSKKEAVVSEFEEADILGKFPPPRARQRSGQARKFHDFGRFLVKTLIIGVVIVAILFIGSNHVSNLLEFSVDNMISKIKKINLGQQIEGELYRAIKHPISPERSKKIVESIRLIVKQYKPFVNEIKHLFSD